MVSGGETTVFVVGGPDAAGIARLLDRERDALDTAVLDSGAAALDRLADADCLVAGLSLPETDGLGLAERVRERDPHTPFVLFTDAPPADLAERAVRAGVTDYVPAAKEERLPERVERAVAEARDERERRRRNERSRALLEGTSDLVGVLSPEGELLHTGPATERLLGYERDEMEGEPGTEFVHPDDREAVAAALDSALADDGPVEATYRFRAADGEYRWMESRFRDRTDDPAIGGIVANTRDVTERVEQRRRHERANERIHALATFTSELHGCETRSAALELAADAARDVLAFDRCTLAVARDGYLHVTEERGAEHGAHMRLPDDEGIAGETYQSGEPLLLDSLRTHPETDADETAAIVSVPVGRHGVFQAVADELGGFGEEDLEIAGLLGDHLAETLSRLDRERALAEQRAFTRDLVNATPDPLYILDSDLRLETFNDAMVEATGYDAEELDGKSALDLVPAGARDRIETRLANLLDTGDGFRAEVRVVRADGERVPYQLNTTCVERDGEPLLVGVARDITERKERERELERQNERLDEFASVVSHDLRTPLNVAAGRVGLARETGEVSHLDAAEDALGRMESLIADVLTLARDGRTVEELSPVAFDAVARAAWRGVSDADATVTFEGADVSVFADEPRLRRALENVFRNSVEHGSTDGPLSVRVGAEPDGETLTLYVADDGPGVPPAERESVLRPGYTTSESGTGLGLGIVSHIADAHGWELSLTESEHGGLRVEFAGVEPAPDSAVAEEFPGE